MVRLTYADFEKNAVRTMQLANHPAWNLNHEYIGTKHILIGLCRHRPPSVSAILSRFGVTFEQITEGVRSRIQPGSNPVDPGRRSPQEAAMRVTEHATQVAANLCATAVGNEHLLLGLLFVHGTTAAEVLNTFGIRYDRVLAQIQRTCQNSSLEASGRQRRS
jgi:ATP-dependent Clp protease ATP-binding subunit ClpA